MHKRIALISVLLAAVSIAQAKQLLDKVVAVVNNGVITASELDKQVALAKKQFLAQRMELPSEQVLRKQILNRLIDVDLQMQMAKEHNISVEENELAQAIERIASANHISVSQMRLEIAKQGMDWNEYRDNLRKEMILSNLQQKAVGHEVLISNEQIEQYLKTEGDLPVDRTKLTYHVQHIVVPLNENATLEQEKKAKAKAESLLADIKKETDLNRLAWEKSTNEFELESGDLGERHLVELPDLFAKEVVHMRTGEVSGLLRAGNGFQIIKLVAIGGEKQHQQVTLTHVRHILLKPDANMLPEDVKKQANNIYQQLKSNKNFAKMAKQYSLDAKSAVKGGDLGWVIPGELVPQFEKVMNKLPLNEVSQPVKTQFGWHLIEVLGRKQQEDSLAFKKQQIRQFLHQRKFAEAVQNWQQHIRTDAYVNIIEKDLA
jgi:peptidyl-prolyl cis-trans isomerase SurA